MVDLCVVIDCEGKQYELQDKGLDLKPNHIYAFSCWLRLREDWFQRLYHEFVLAEGVNKITLALQAGRDQTTFHMMRFPQLKEDELVWGQMVEYVRSPWIQCSRPEGQPPAPPGPSNDLDRWPPGFRHDRHTVKEMADDLHAEIDYRGDLSLADRLQRIANNDDAPDLLIHGDGKGWKCWKHLVGNGYRLSVQGSRNTLCEPEFSDGPYTHLEVADMSETRDMIPGWERYHNYDNIYSKVPLDEIRRVLGIEEKP